jgi:hypothetical protein
MEYIFHNTHALRLAELWAILGIVGYVITFPVDMEINTLHILLLTVSYPLL